MLNNGPMTLRADLPRIFRAEPIVQLRREEAAERRRRS
jgi:hypothetical protein